MQTGVSAGLRRRGVSAGARWPARRRARCPWIRRSGCGSPARAADGIAGPAQPRSRLSADAVPPVSLIRFKWATKKIRLEKKNLISKKCASFDSCERLTLA